MTKVFGLEDDVASKATESKVFRVPAQRLRPSRGIAGYRAVHQPVEVYDPDTGKTVKVIKARTPSEDK